MAEVRRKMSWDFALMQTWGLLIAWDKMAAREVILKSLCCEYVMKIIPIVFDERFYFFLQNGKFIDDFKVLGLNNCWEDRVDIY
jgi:hypothetical protein